MPQFGQAGYQPGMGYLPQQQKRRIGPWLLVLVGVLVIGLLGYGVFRLASQGSLTPTGGTAGGNASVNPCPVSTQTPVPVPHPADGRVHGGMISYPMLGSPWSGPREDNRVPFGSDIAEQYIVTEDNYDGQGSSWMASVLVGNLVAGDGFFSPQEGSEIVVKCLIGVFYGNAKVTRDDKVNKATTLDGKDAWLVETHLSFNIPHLQATGETAIVLIVATATDSSSIFYASIPDNASQYLQPARDAMANLTVGP